jgi:tRNA(Ile)-lysidine synthase
MAALGEHVKTIILREKLIEEGDLVLVGVSGGADSLSLLHLLNELRQENFISFSLYVAHLNHGIRGDSARGDAEFVRRIAKKMLLPCTVGQVNTDIFRKRWRLSIEDAARHLRYSFLQQLAKRVGALRIAVGHNRDDQVETLLLNFLRGTGLDGLTGIKFKRETGEGEQYIIRPFLETGRAEIEQYCRENGLQPRIDETNQDARFLRNKVRLQLLPSLEEDYNPNIRKGLSRLSYLLSLDSNYLISTAAKSLKAIICAEKTDYLELDGEKLLREHEALQGRILRLAISRLLGTVPREIGYKRIRDILKMYGKGSPHAVLHLARGLKVSKSYKKLSISKERATKTKPFSPFILPVPGKKAFYEEKMAIVAGIFLMGELKWPPEGRKEAYLDYDRVLLFSGDNKHEHTSQNGLNLLVRTRRDGDRFHPLGSPGKKKLKKYLIDKKVPLRERDFLPLVLAGDIIVWVAGKQISDTCKVTENTKKVLVLRLEEG